MEPEFDLIDRVARDLTDASPSGDFRVRVISKLQPPRRQNFFHYAATAAAGLAAGILIMTLGRQEPVGPDGPKGPMGPNGSSTASSVNRNNSGATNVRDSSAREPSGPIGPIGPKGPIGPTGGVLLGPDGPFPLVVISPLERSELSITPLVLPPVRTGGSQR
jgi:hypothetical protein